MLYCYKKYFHLKLRVDFKICGYDLHISMYENVSKSIAAKKKKLANVFPYRKNLELCLIRSQLSKRSIQAFVFLRQFYLFN